jgi:ribosomal protein S18 acetylase RimI-like enzyme
MSAPKYLIDTNVFIGLEDTREVTPEFASLVQLAAKHNVGVYIHEAAKDDIARDRDAERRRVSLSKLDKFQVISKVRGLDRDHLEANFGRLTRPNDVVDATLLDALAIGVADFLVTEDGGLHDRARRHSPELERRVLFVADAVSLLRTTYEPIDVPIRFVEEVDANTIPSSDPIFDSLREGYAEFDEWWREKCVREQRKCWVVTDQGSLAGILVRKEERRPNTDATSPGDRILKLCTFKVRPENRGTKLGELLLKQALWFAQKNRFDVVYVTAYPEQTALIDLLSYYGFERTKVTEDGEITFEKPLSRIVVGPADADDFFEFARREYPRFYAGPGIDAYVVPIRGHYHEALFPELRDETQPELFEFGGIGSGAKKPGNTIRKVYLCRAQARIDQSGALLFFYKGKSQRGPSQALTSVGVLEDMTLAHSTEELRRLAGGRSVYSERQLVNWNASPESPVKVINFLLVGHIAPPMFLAELAYDGVFRGHPPQSIIRLERSKLESILDRLDLGFQIQ